MQVSAQSTLKGVGKFLETQFSQQAALIDEQTVAINRLSSRLDQAENDLQKDLSAPRAHVDCSEHHSRLPVFVHG